MSEICLPAWSIHDDPKGYCDSEERNWIAVAAENEDHARVLAAAFYNGEAPREEFDWKTAFVFRGPIDTTIWPERLQPQYPQLIRDPECLRLLGWREESEPECDSCGLASMGLEQYAICDRCDCCKECCECQPTLAEWMEGWEASSDEGTRQTISREEAERRYYKKYPPHSGHQNGED